MSRKSPVRLIFVATSPFSSHGWLDDYSTVMRQWWWSRKIWLSWSGPYDDNSQEEDYRRSISVPMTPNECKRSVLMRVLSDIHGQRGIPDSQRLGHDDDTRGADLVANDEFLPVW